MSESSMFEAYPVLAAQVERASGSIAQAAFKLMERRTSAYSDLWDEASRSFAPASATELPARYFQRMVDDYGAAMSEVLTAWPAPAAEAAPAAPEPQPVAEAAMEVIEEPFAVIEEIVEAAPAMEPEVSTKSGKPRRPASAPADEGHVGGHDGHEEDVRV